MTPKDPKIILPRDDLKKKVGSGGLGADIIEKAQSLVDNNTFDFVHMAMKQITALKEAQVMVATRKDNFETTDLLEALILPAMQLKANGKMFHFPFVTDVAILFIHFLENLQHINDDSLEVIHGFIVALNASIVSEMRTSDKKSAQDLYAALENACVRYVERNH